MDFSEWLPALRGVAREQRPGSGRAFRSPPGRIAVARIHVAVPVAQGQDVEFAVALLLHHRLGQLLGVLVAVADLAHEFPPDVVTDREAFGFVLRCVDHGADATLLNPLWKRLHLHRVKNRFGPGTKARFSGILQEMAPEKVDDCRSGWDWRSWIGAGEGNRIHPHRFAGILRNRRKYSCGRLLPQFPFSANTKTHPLLPKLRCRAVSCRNTSRHDTATKLTNSERFTPAAGSADGFSRIFPPPADRSGCRCGAAVACLNKILGPSDDCRGFP